MDVITDFVLAAAATPWVFLVLLAAIAIDGFFPPVPGEVILVAIATLAWTTGAPAFALVAVVAIIGAWIGDNIAYLIGRRVGTQPWRWMSTPAIARARERARTGLARRPAIFLITGRFIPVVRVLVNLTAGATRLPYRRFVVISAAASTAWVTLTVLIAIVAGSLVKSSPLLATGLAVAIALILGAVTDAIVSRRDRAADRELAASLERPDRELDAVACR